jgi:hypothetical protein
MAGGDLRLNNRKLKVKSFYKNLPDFVEADITPLTWVTNYMLHKFLLQTLKSCTQTTLLSVKISRAAMKAAQRLQKLQAPAKERKNIFLQYQKHQFQHWLLFFRFCFFGYLFSKLKFKTSFSEQLSN